MDFFNIVLKKTKNNLRTFTFSFATIFKFLTTMYSTILDEIVFNLRLAEAVIAITAAFLGTGFLAASIVLASLIHNLIKLVSSYFLIASFKTTNDEKDSKQVKAIVIFTI